MMRKGKRSEKEYWEQEPSPLRSEVARAIRQTASRKATGAHDLVTVMDVTFELD